MKQLTFQFLLLFLCVSSCWEMSAQQTQVSVPATSFERCLGGSGQDSSIFATVTSTGDYLFIGNTTSTNGDVVGNHGGKDIWMVKVNASGTILSQACYGGSNNDYVKTVKDLGNDEYLLSGVAQSGNGNVVGYSGSGQNDWTLKINASGAILWQQCAASAAAQSIVLANGNLLTINWITSAGNANNYHGGIDSWVKITDLTNGNILLNKCYGGTGDDKLKKVWEESGAIFMGGATNSTNGDITGQHGGYDIWVLKIDAAGNILNQNVLGGSDQEYFKNVYKNSFGNYVIDAYTGSQDGNIGNFQPYSTTTFTGINPFTGTATDSICQFWSLMLNNTLTLQWEKTINTLLLNSDASYVANGICFENSIQIFVVTAFGGYISFNSESLPTYDGGVWIIGQTFEENASSSGNYLMHYYAVKISSAGLIQSNVPIHQEISQELINGGMTYYLTSSATIRTNYGMVEQCPTCGGGEEHHHGEINTAGNFLSRCDTTIHTNYPSAPSISINTLGTCPISVTAITPAYSTGTLSQGFSSTSTLQNDTCSSGAFTHISTNNSIYYATLIGQSSGNNWSFTLNNAYIHKIDCKPDGVFALANTRINNIQAVGNHGLLDIWLLKVDDPNNLYGGKLWKDNNTNTIYDTGDQLMANRIFSVKLNNTNNTYYIPTDAQGRYRIATGKDSLTAILTNPPLYHTFSPAQFSKKFLTNGNTDTLNDVVLTPTPNISDMFASLTAINNPQPGFDTDYNLTYKNQGTVAKTGSVRMTWNAADQVFVSATPTPDTLTTSYAAWKYTNMPSLASASINIKLNTTSFNLGANIQNLANVYPIVGDQTPSNNQDTSDIILVGAYDPNDIAVSDTLIDSTYMASNGYVTYTIRFQNTGTAPATNVLITSINAGTGFDITSFEPIAQSHPYKLFAPLLQFKFENIMLPDSGSNQAASHGFIKFRMRLTNYSRCQISTSKANIYFDNNPAIVTNTVQTRHALNRPVPTISGPLTFCTGNNVVLTVPPGYASYTWSPSGSHALSLTLSSPIGTSTYALTIKKQAGCYATSLPIQVTINPIPTATISSTGLLIFCSAQANTTLNANIVTGYNYAWNLNGTAIPGATNPSYSPLQTGSYNFTVVDANGCTKTSLTKAITVNPSPAVSITPVGNVGLCTGDTLSLTSTTTAGVTYQWQKNNTSITGATANFYKTVAAGSYRLIVKTTANCKDTSDVTAGTFSTAPATPSISNTGNLTFCQGGSVALNISTGTGYTYTWNNNGNPISGANSASYIATQSGSYTGTVSNNGCQRTSAAKVVTVNPTPAIPTISQTLNILTSSAATGNQWNLNGNPIIGATSTTFVANLSGTYTLTVTETTGCTSTSAPYSFVYTPLLVTIGTCGLSANVSMDLQWYLNGVAISGATNQNYTPTVTGSYSFTSFGSTSDTVELSSLFSPTLSTNMPTICIGGTAQLSVTNIPSATYSWQYFNTTSNIWLDLTGVTGLTYSQVLTTSRMYRVNYVTPCGSGTTPAVTVTVIPDPVATVSSSNVNLCSGTNTTLTATLTGGTGTPIYQWQEQISGVYTNIAGATNQTYTTPNLTASKNYKVVSSMSGSGCNASGTGLISLVVKTLPTVVATPASPSYCVGGTVSIAASGASTYSWSPATGLSAATGTPVIASGTSSATYTLTGTGTNGCSKTISVPVTVNPDPSISISGNNSVCSGATTTFTATNAGGSGTCSLVWQSSTNGTTWTTISGATGTTYTTPALSANTYYRATYTCTGGGCSPAAVSNSIYVTLISPTPMMLSTSTPTICTGGTAQLSLNAGTSGTTYTWQYLNTTNNVWTNISGYLGTTNTTYSAVLTASASYRVLYATSCGTGTTATVMVNVIPDPTVTVASSNNNFCAGGNTTLTATLTGGIGTPSYQWQEFVANVYNNVAGATNATYTTASITANKYYKVLATMSGSGCGVTGTGVILVSVLPLPTVAVSPASPTYCVGGSVSLAASGTAGNTYSWSPATNLSATTGTPVIASPQATTSYTLTGIGTNGCTKTITIPVTVTADPSISISGPNSVPTGTTANLSASVTGGSGTCTRQWQSSTNGTSWTNISGATGTSYTTPAITGTKYYRASYNCTASGCSPIAYSNTLAIIGVQPPARMEMPNNELSLSLFPNPADVKIIVHLDMTKDANTEFAINNLVGEEVIKWQGQSENGSYEQEISIENLASGVYFLTAKIEGRTMIQKFVKE